MLPYLEQENLHNQIRFDKDIKDAVNATPRSTSLPRFRCPSDDGAPNLQGGFAGRLDARLFSSRHRYQRAAGSRRPQQLYRTLRQSADNPRSGLPTLPGRDRDAAHRGMFCRNAAVRIADVKDGTSNTLFRGRTEHRPRLCHVDGGSYRRAGAAQNTRPI